MARPKRSSKALSISRVFDASPELVWKAWTEPDMLKIGLRVGGKYLNCMRSPDRKDYWSTGVYREIVPLKRIVYTDSFADEKGNVVPATHYGLGSDMPLEMLVTVTFEKYGGKTRMTLRHVGLPAGRMSKLAGQGWNESFDKLSESLK